MTRTLQAKDAVEIIEAAFAPLRCVAESLDHDDHISFRVFDASDSPLLSVEKINLLTLNDLRLLSTRCVHVQNWLIAESILSLGSYQKASRRFKAAAEIYHN